MAVHKPDKTETDEEQKRKKVRKTGKSDQPAANDAAKYRLYPTPQQYELIVKTFGCTRYYWNLIIDIAHITHDELGYSLVITDTEAKHLEGCEFLKEVDSLALANVFMNYNQAWQNYKTNPSHFGKPTWKKRRGLEASYSTNNQPKWDKKQKKYITKGSIRIEDGKIQLPKIGWVELLQHYELPDGAIIKNATVSRDCAGRVFVSIGYYNPELAQIMENAGLDSSKDALVVTGLDYSNPRLFVNECGFSPKDVHYYKQNEVKLAKLQRKLARRKPGSSNYKKLNLRIARLHRRIANQRRDLLHKLSYELAEKCDVIVVENLDMKAMAKHKKDGKFSFGKSVNDNAWGTFLTYLDYKLQRRHGQLVKVAKTYPSSKRCHHCGAINDGLELSNRSWKCEMCGAFHNRDVNAAWNILLEGVRMLRAGEIAGVSVAADVNFKCADGTSVTASTRMSKDMGCSVLPVEVCKTVQDAFAYCICNANLRSGDAELREAGKETVWNQCMIPVITEAPTSTPRA